MLTDSKHDTSFLTRASVGIRSTQCTHLNFTILGLTHLLRKNKTLRLLPYVAMTEIRSPCVSPAFVLVSDKKLNKFQAKYWQMSNFPHLGR